MMQIVIEKKETGLSITPDIICSIYTAEKSLAGKIKYTEEKEKELINIIENFFKKG